MILTRCLGLAFEGLAPQLRMTNGTPMHLELKMNRKRFLSLFSLLLLLLLPSVSLAKGKAESFVKTHQAELVTLLKADSSKSQRDKIHHVFDQILDYDTLARKSLGSATWKKRSEAEREEFSGLLKDLVRQAYERNLRKTLNYQVTFDGEVKDRGKYLVRTTAKSKSDKRQEPVSVDYVVTEASGKLLIIDIVTEGSSLTRGYRSQFKRILKKKGWDELIRLMKKKRDA